MGYQQIRKSGQKKAKSFRVVFDFDFGDRDLKEMSNYFYTGNTDILSQAQDEAGDLFEQKPTFERIDKNPAPAFFSYPFDDLTDIKNIIEEYGSDGIIELPSGVKMQNFEAAQYHPANTNPYYPLSEWDSTLEGNASLQMNHLSRAIAQLEETTLPEDKSPATKELTSGGTVAKEEEVPALNDITIDLFKAIYLVGHAGGKLMGYYSMFNHRDMKRMKAQLDVYMERTNLHPTIWYTKGNEPTRKYGPDQYGELWNILFDM